MLAAVAVLPQVPIQQVVKQAQVAAVLAVQMVGLLVMELQILAAVAAEQPPTTLVEAALAALEL